MGVIPQGQEKYPKGRGSCLPRELRIKLFDEVVGLRKRGLSYGEIIDEVYRRHGVKLSKSNISEWSRGIHSPYNGRYIPSIELLKPSEELAYIIGVKLGDGYVTKYGLRTKIGLHVKDREFAEEFSRCLAKVLGRAPIKPKYRRSLKSYVVEARSKTLYQMLKKPVDMRKLKRYIEHCKDCMAAFVRGFADSEGCIDKNGYIAIYNTDLRLLTYVKGLLHQLGIESTGPKIHVRRGTVFYDRRMGKNYTTKKDVYRLRIRRPHNHRFYEKVGFTIKRKRKRLEEYFKRRQSQTPSPLLSPTNNADRVG